MSFLAHAFVSISLAFDPCSEQKKYKPSVVNFMMSFLAHAFVSISLAFDPCSEQKKYKPSVVNFMIDLVLYHSSGVAVSKQTSKIFFLRHNRLILYHSSEVAVSKQTIKFFFCVAFIHDDDALEEACVRLTTRLVPKWRCLNRRAKSSFCVAFIHDDDALEEVCVRLTTRLAKYLPLFSYPLYPSLRSAPMTQPGLWPAGRCYFSLSLFLTLSIHAIYIYISASIMYIHIAN
jgi:hypothetical protein